MKIATGESPGKAASKAEMPMKQPGGTAPEGDSGDEGGGAVGGGPVGDGGDELWARRSSKRDRGEEAAQECREACADRREDDDGEQEGEEAGEEAASLKQNLMGGLSQCYFDLLPHESLLMVFAGRLNADGLAVRG